MGGNKAYDVSFSPHSSGDPQSNETLAYVHLENDRMTVHCIISECGNDRRLAITKVAVEVLNVPMEAVTVVQANNSTGPTDFGLAGPRGTITGDTAVGRVAAEAGKRLLKETVPIMGCNPEELDTKDTMIFKKDNPSNRIP